MVSGSLLGPWVPWGAYSSHSHCNWKFPWVTLIGTEEKLGTDCLLVFDDCFMGR